LQKNTGITRNQHKPFNLHYKHQLQEVLDVPSFRCRNYQRREAAGICNVNIDVSSKQGLKGKANLLFAERHQSEFIIIVNEVDVQSTTLPRVTITLNFSSLFSISRNLDTVSFKEDISRWNMSSAIDTSKMFWQAWNFNGNLSTWDMSNVINMSEKFAGADLFAGIGLDQWSTSWVEKMNGMFAGASEFDANLSHWDVCSVTDMSYMFVTSENRSIMDIEKPDG
jgi:surface protein